MKISLLVYIFLICRLLDYSFFIFEKQQIFSLHHVLLSVLHRLIQTESLFLTPLKIVESNTLFVKQATHKMTVKRETSVQAFMGRENAIKFEG